MKLKDVLEKAELNAICDALIFNSLMLGKAADALGISRKNLWEKMRKHGLGLKSRFDHPSDFLKFIEQRRRASA